MHYAGLIFLHVAFGVFWAGGAIAMGFFVVPAVLEAGPAGGAVMGGVLKRKFAVVMSLAGLMVVATGSWLYVIRMSSAWLASPEGIVLSLGGVLGLGGFVVGFFVQRPTAERMAALGDEIAASGGPPSAAQAAELAALRTRLGKVARVLAFHLLGATLLMAAHRLAAAL